ncbi:hypothetical protein VUR80DRAFT_367 [Thermomyces stellatus]
MSREDVYAQDTSAGLLRQIRHLQLSDPECRRLRDSSTHGTAAMPEWSVRDDLLRWKDRVYIPQDASVRREILKLYHDDPLAGHFGRDKTTELIQRRFHWKKLQEEVGDYIRGCSICQGTTTKRHRPYGELQPLPQPSRPFKEISMDFISGLPEVFDGQRHVNCILVIVDRFTKYALFFAVPSTIDSAELARLVHNEVELNNLWSELCYHTKVKQRLSTAFHPQTDGQTEALNQILERYLRCFVSDDQSNWHTLLRSAEYCHNNSRNATTGESPFMALYGYHPELRLDIAVEDDAHEGGVPGVHTRLRKLEAVREKMKEHYRYAVDTQKRYYNQRHQPIKFRRGQLIMLSTRNLRFEATKTKLAPRYIGPFRVLEVVGKQAYRIALPAKYSRLHNVFPVSLLEPCRRRRMGGRGNPRSDHCSRGNVLPGQMEGLACRVQLLPTSRGLGECATCDCGLREKAEETGPGGNTSNTKEKVGVEMEITTLRTGAATAKSVTSLRRLKIAVALGDL